MTPYYRKQWKVKQRALTANPQLVLVCKFDNHTVIRKTECVDGVWRDVE